ncbi:MAG: hypothetical protein QXJ02_05805, partial [Candidatus Bathyarchaeia archaeon]
YLGGAYTWTRRTNYLKLMQEHHASLNKVNSKNGKIVGTMLKQNLVSKQEKRAQHTKFASKT